MAPRLRRSQRNLPPSAAPSQAEKFDRLISYVSDRSTRETMREFHLPTHILVSIKTSPAQSPSRLERLLPDAVLSVLDKLTGNDLIMLALTSKTMAAYVEACTIRKIANIDFYEIRNRDVPLEVRQKDDNDAEWRDLGFLGRPACPIDLPRKYSTWYAGGDQRNDLLKRVGAYLGNEHYAFCSLCRKFRPLQKQFWVDFAEYESPGITAQAHTRITHVLDNWTSGTSCPAHGLLSESKGKRVVLRA